MTGKLFGFWFISIFVILGQKYEFAKKWKMHIIKSDWLYDSVEKGYCLEEKKYYLEGGKESDVKTSTPEKGPAKSKNGFYSFLPLTDFIHTTQSSN